MMKPYYSLNTYFQNTYGEKCYKIALDAGFTCPNRDGRLGKKGCIFCSVGGSGDFAMTATAGQITTQLKEGLKLFHEKKVGNRFVAYFQAYTNTYGPVSHLEALYREALDCKEVCGISIATRPDCMAYDVIDLLVQLQKEYSSKFIWIELGLQSIHEKTASYIRRGYPLSVFEDTMKRLHAVSIPVIVHVILGLPGEDVGMMYETVQYLNHLKPFGIKLQLLHVLRGTDLADLLPQMSILSKDEYIDIVIHCLELLDPRIVIHRVTGDGPKELLLAPTWSLNKRGVLNTLHHRMKLMQTYQGRLYYDTRSTDTI